MKLGKILNNIEFESKNFADLDITGIEHDSRRIKNGDIYVCLKGLSVDGHDYARAACDAGASCIIAERYMEGIDAVQILVQDSRVAYSVAASNWYGNPYKRLKIIAVTGTKGKTTTTQVIRTILETAGYKTAVMGTLGTFIGKEKYEQNLTTPDPMDFHKLLSIIAKKKCGYVVMELSAHALYLKKTEPVKFVAGVFTNLSHDHLDDFITMENYMNAKKKLFMGDKCEIGVINIDDDAYSDIMSEFEGSKLVTYGTKPQANYRAQNVKCNLSDVQYCVDLDGECRGITFAIPGMFNVYNSLAAVTVCRELGVSIGDILNGISKVKNVDGRMESIDCGQDFTVIVDYAHSPDSLSNVLTAARGFTHNKVISVFGCGGDRDTKKRPVMGALSNELADYTIITSDNPRTEDPDSIIDMIEAGMITNEYKRITDRTLAIYDSLDMAQKGDVVVIAGKGHETYQDVMGKKHHFDDREVVRQYFKEKEQE